MKRFFNKYVQSIETYIMFRIKERVAQLTPELIKKNRKPISLSMGAPTDNPPEYALNLLKKYVDEDKIHTYSSPKGEKYLRKAISERMKNKFNVELNPDNEIFSLIGSKEGIANIIRGIIDITDNNSDKDIILTPDPGYASYKEMVKVSGGIAYPVPLTAENNYMPNMEEVLKKFINDGFNPKKIKALLINYPNNPLGCVATKEYLQSVVEFCKKHDILLISDAAYIDMAFDNSIKMPSVLEIEGAKDIAVEFFSFSKPYAMTGWRIGWVCGNKEAISYFGRLKSTIDSGIYKPIQKVASEVINSKDGDEYIKQANIKLKKKQEIFVEGLKELGWKNFYIPNATFYLWLPIPPKYKKSVDFTNDLMEKSGVVTVPGNAFGDNGEGFFRVSIVCTENDLKEVIKRMKEDGFYFE